ncbi:MAG: 50S ribosomal protein L32 [Brevinematales bacterium]|nr:50S ribosomal protein L32 [Brevinematales bacterium]
MGVPKHKKSHRRIRNRRTRVFYHTLGFPEEVLVKSEDGDWKLPHRASITTGKYKGINYIDYTKREERKKRKQQEMAKYKV